ncbi:MAG: hypothetical protein RBT11_04880 [Desulfobacterales bacterium]|jgi:hypothetical protein|nr:hypothetical protein [Desulfobacterales bacterium]
MNAYLKSVVWLLSVLWVCPAFGGNPGTVHISGAVNNPLSLNVKQLALFESTAVQLNEITSDKKYHGAFVYRGVSLKTLLDAAGIEKKNTDFKKPVDLAVVVKTASGKQIALSWGEIYFKNPQQVVVAYAAVPIFPRKGMDHFADQKAYHEMIAILNRKIDFPKLVITGDIYTDRCLEAVTNIMVHDLRPNVPGEKSPSPFSAKFSVSGAVAVSKTYEKLPGHSPVEFFYSVLGEGRGYHGTHSFSGIPLRNLIQASSPNLDMNTVFLISAPDGYRSLISCGELVLSPYEDRIILADTRDGNPITQNGYFMLVLRDDLMADRMVKAVRKIDVIRLNAP